MANSRHIGIMFVRVDKVRLGTKRVDHAENRANCFVRGLHRWANAPRRAPKKLTIGALDTRFFTSHRMTANKADRPRQKLVGPREYFALCRGHIGHCRAMFQQWSDVAQNLL